MKPAYQVIEMTISGAGPPLLVTSPYQQGETTYSYQWLHVCNTRIASMVLSKARKNVTKNIINFSKERTPES